MKFSRDWLVAFLIALLITVLAQTPYLIGYANTRPDFFFTGIIMNPEDAQSYFAKMLQGHDGAWLYTIPFTTEAHSPAFLGVFYLALGHMARILGLSLDVVWHAARVIADMILFLTTFGFISAFLEDTRTRWTAYLLALFGSGLGWVLFLLNQPYWLDTFPLDFKMPEAHLFFSAMTFSHVEIGTALMITTFWLIKQASDNGWAMRYAVGTGIVNLLLAVVYPFLIYLIVVALVIYWVYRTVSQRRIAWHEGIWSAIALVIPAPLLLYYAYTLMTNPVMREWDAQAITLSPPLPHYLVAFGVMLLLGLPLIKRREFALLWIWILAVAVLVYAPLNPQRRFVQGIQVPLAILTSVGLIEFVLPRIALTRAFQWLAARPNYSTAGLQRLLIVLFLLMMSLSNLYVLASTSITAGWQQPYPLFRSNSEIAAVDWLRVNTRRTDVVLGAYETGNYVAAQAGNRVVVGHWAETFGWDLKFNQAERFFDASTDDAWRVALLREYRIAYVFWGRSERDLGAFDPGRMINLRPVFTNLGCTIYQVIW